jgi:hypothetical protein
MLTLGSASECLWARAIRLIRTLIHIHMLTRIRATITTLIIIPTGMATATVIQDMDIGAVDFGAAIVTAMTGAVDFAAASVDSTVVVDFMEAVGTDAVGKSIR